MAQAQKKGGGDLVSLLSKRAAKAPARPDPKEAARSSKREGLVAIMKELREAKSDEDAAEAFLAALDYAKDD